MKENDYVKLTAEKEKYAKYGIHKGMEGSICDSRVINKKRLVEFEDGIGNTIEIIAVNEADLELVSEAPLIREGSRVLLFREIYLRLGLKVGAPGVVGRPISDGSWLVRFDMQDGVSKPVEVSVRENEMTLCPDI